ncbi:MAG: DNA-binding protein [Hydrogenophilales bacterium CG_4_10_14_3_um_filter_58_23]|nr:MAG: DNA-binding protein [Hydrogenophilales bacterium CG_4_10_14_3_um_filter_58_23]
MSLLELYKAFRAADESGKKARALLEQEHWFAVNAEFDPKTGLALPQALSAFLAKVARPATDGTTRDRLWRITEHSRASVERLFHTLNESPRREHALLSIHAVRELDANSFIKLSNRPGRNIREKLAGKPYMQAVRRFQSVNLPENRLLKAFVIRLAELLELRRYSLNEAEDDLLPKIQSWMRSNEAQAIARWDNLPPNNTLISHRDYRRVWDAWRWLQTLDEDIAHDFSQIEAREKTMRLWKQCAQMWADGRHLFAEMPVLFDLEKFDIRPWGSSLSFQKSKQTISRQIRKDELTEPACLDLSGLRPRYATKETSRLLCESYLWQQWKSDGESVDIALFNADAAYLHPDATSITSSDLFFSKDNTSEYFDRAARTFASKLREVFKNDTLIWLIPDSLNDFELEVTRRNLNARFPDAEPLPRSVAAAFEQIHYSKIRYDGFPIVVVDNLGGNTCVTKLIARFNKELKDIIPKTGGFYWERCPPVNIAGTNWESTEAIGYDLLTVNGQGQWCSEVALPEKQFIDHSTLKSDLRVGQFEVCINLAKSPVVGGIRLHSLQQLAGDIPLWRDQIPELSIKVMKDGHYQRFHLVLRGTTVKPIRGKAVSIPIDKDFTLPAGKPFYEFPLFLGENADDLGFSARLDSPVFPLKENAVCRLDLTFEYGADDPYKLVFTPHETAFLPVRATWHRTKEVIITNAPAPEYPTPMTWAELCSVPKQNSTETNNLLEWVQNAIARLDQDIYIRPKPRTTGVIKAGWGTDKKGGHFAFATCNSTVESVFIHENSFVNGLNYADFTEGKSISFELQEREGKYSGRKVAGPRYKESDHLKDFDEDFARNFVVKIRKGLYYPVIQVWRDGRSISDQECPKKFADAMQNDIAYLVALLSENALPESVKNEILFLLSSMHKNAPDECVRWITRQVKNGNIRATRTVGFALGRVSEQWQKDTLFKLVTHPTAYSLRVFAYAVWREPHFVDRFSFAELQSILKELIVMLSESPQSDENSVRKWVRAIVEPLELLLGLLRTRASSDMEIKMLLQPHQKITKELAKQNERITDIVAQSNVSLFSRVQINIKKPEGECTPDLLYALRLYLTGDDGANAIHITSVSDSDND